MVGKIGLLQSRHPTDGRGIISKSSDQKTRTFTLGEDKDRTHAHSVSVVDSRFLDSFTDLERYDEIY